MRLQRQSGSDLDFSLNVLNASPQVKENQRGHSPGDLGQRHHPHLSQTFGLNQHLERLNHILGNISDFTWAS